MSEPSPNESHTTFSFEQILGVIADKQKSARVPAARASWERLRSVADELAQKPADELEALITGRRWHLQCLSVTNFRGIANAEPLELHIDPTPGITVFHGPNGAGKSSLSDAVEYALTGALPPPTGGAASNAALWDPVHLARDASSASVTITLTCGDERLVLTSELGSSGETLPRTAILHSAHGASAITLTEAWQVAVNSHKPVFAYAALERRVQRSKDLVSYFEDLLALSNSFAQMQETIAQRAESSHDAASKWTAYWQQASAGLIKADQRHAESTGAALLATTIVPSLQDEVEDWTRQANLDPASLQTEPFQSDIHDRFTKSAQALCDAVLELRNKGSAASLPLAHSLLELKKESSSSQHVDGPCPVCDSHNAEWFETLSTKLRDNDILAKLLGRAQEATRSFADLCESTMERILELALADPRNAQLVEPVAKGRALYATFLEVRASSSDTQHETLKASESLASWILSSDANEVFSHVTDVTDAQRQWRVARHAAAADFIQYWTEHGATARESELWKQTSKRVVELRRALRTQRGDSLKEKTNPRIQKLLADAGIHLTDISLLEKQASMSLVDENENAVQLGMLSAGQRNAVLLSPVLASVDAGPFGFLILDDPVHAFDELRVDRLAEQLADLAVSRRVIVLTHDDRLKENLSARTDRADTRLVERSASDGVVRVSESGEFWFQLVDDAHALFDLAVVDDIPLETITHTVRSLCRLAIDSALRMFIIRNAIRNSSHSAADLTTVDKAPTTERRLNAAASLWQESDLSNPVRRAKSGCADFLPAWNQAVHGNAITSVVTKDEIHAARDACKKLVSWS